MGAIAPWQLALGFLGTVIVAGLAYLGARHTATSSRAGAERASHVDAQQSALDAWESLLAPYKAEVKELRSELIAERDDRAEQQKRVERRRIEAKAEVDEQMDDMRREIAALTTQLGEWKRLAKVIARWATTLRDQVLSLGGTVPATPEELLTLQAIEDAEQVGPPAPPATP